MHWKGLNTLYNYVKLFLIAIFNLSDILKFSFQNWAKFREFCEKSTSFTMSPLNMCKWKRTLISMCRPLQVLLNALREKLNTQVVLNKSEFYWKKHDFKLVKPIALLILRVRIIGRRNSMSKVYQSAIQFVN